MDVLGEDAYKKENRGLGFRELSKFNLAMLVKQ